MLETAAVIDAGLADRLKRMVGFRNVAIHDDRTLSLDMVRRIIVERLEDYAEFVAVMFRT